LAVLNRLSECAAQWRSDVVTCVFFTTVHSNHCNAFRTRSWASHAAPVLFTPTRHICRAGAGCDLIPPDAACICSQSQHDLIEARNVDFCTAPSRTQVATLHVLSLENASPSAYSKQREKSAEDGLRTYTLAREA
jgi:hypothetical protein